jgi:3-oxoacyl-[acyl-carrier-protein] synthase-1
LNNAWGFVPGEAGAALLIAGPAVAQGGDLRSRAVLRRLGLGVEAQTIKTATVCVGEGLTEALRRALAGLPDGTQVSDIYADLNGEPYRADEYGFASVRVGSAFADAGAFVAPADCWGDVGAASGAMLMMAASVAASKGYSRGRWGLVWASSEGGDRAAVLMEGTPADGDRP